MRTIAPPAGLPAMIEHWVDAGIISPDQAELMRTDTAALPTGAAPPIASGPAPVPPGRVTSLVTEGLGYLGAVLVAVASILVTSQVWDQLGTVGQLALTGAATVLLLLAGAAVPVRPGPAVRLRAVLWLVASATLFALLTLAGTDGFGWTGSAVTSFAAVGTGLASAGLWATHRHLLQHLAVLVSAVIAAGSATDLLGGPDALPGLAVWGVGAVWAVLSWGGVIKPGRAGLILGSVVTLFAAMTLTGPGWGSALALATVAALVLLAVTIRDLALLGAASIGTLFVLPRVVAQVFPGVFAAALALLAVGLVLVAAAVVTARRPTVAIRAVPVDHSGGPAADRDWSSGRPRSAVLAAAVIAIGTAALVIAIGV